MKSAYCKPLWLGFVALTFSVMMSPAYAQRGGGGHGGREGTRDGGNGTFVWVERSRNLIFWDLFVNDPNFRDEQSGDQLALKGSQRKPIAGDWVDQQKLQSYALMNQRLAKWQARAPNLLNHLGDDLILIGTPLYIQMLEEIDVPSKLNLNGVRAVPGAFFIPENEEVFLNHEMWNHAGLISQAAMLLHEKLRPVQIDFGISNAELQNLVYLIMVREPSQVSVADYDDGMFSLLRFNPKKVDSTSQMSKYFGQFGLDSSGYQRLLYRVNSLGKRMEIKKSIELGFYNADSEVVAASEAGILGPQYRGDMKLVTGGENTVPNRKPLPALTPTTGVILDPSNCPQVLSVHNDPTYMNTHRLPLNCGAAGLDGSGGLIFESPVVDEFDLEVKGTLNTNNDGGSEIAVIAAGIRADIHVEGESDAVLTIGNSGSELRLAGIKQLHAFVFRYMFKDRKVAIVLNDNGDYQHNSPLMTWDIPASVQLQPGASSFEWRYYTLNLSTVRMMKGLIPGAPSGPAEVGAFEYWERMNAEGWGYVSAEGEKCKWGYYSVKHDEASNRDECMVQQNYSSEPGKTCGSGYVSIYKDPKTQVRSCRSLKGLESYDNEEGVTSCVAPFIPTGIFRNQSGCVDPSKTNIYYLRKPFDQNNCAAGFEANEDSESNGPDKPRAHMRRCTRVRTGESK